MERNKMDASAPGEQQQPFKSKLQDAPERFLAYAIEHSLKLGRRTAADFIRHFPPSTIMEGLEDEPQLRANILVTATGVRMKVALKKSAASCGSDLQIALDEHETDAATVVALFDPDDRVRFLDNRALWNFVTEGEFWLAELKKDAKVHALSAMHISYLIERGLEDQLLTHRDVVAGITVQSMTNLLPRSELPKIIGAALELGQNKKPFVEKNLLDAISITTLCQHIPLSAIWTQVVVPYIAEAHALTSKPEPEEVHDASETKRGEVVRPQAAAPAAQPAPAQAAQAQAAAPAAQQKAQATFAAVARPAAAPAAKPAPAPAAAKPAPAADDGLDVDVDEMIGSLVKPSTKTNGRRPGSIPPTA